MKVIRCHTIIVLLLAVCLMQTASAQQPNILRGIGNRIPRGGGGPSGDSLERRNRFEDSLTIYYRYLDSARTYQLDSSISDFTTRFPIPAQYTYLGNVGTAARSLLFSPRLQAGFDPGFHAYDIYKWNLEQVRFFNATRPYTELGYVLGSQTQQILEVVHTQNIRPNWNFALQYRSINAPGFFKNQKTNHNNYLLSSWYQSRNRRYNNFLMVLANRLQSGENGGILSEDLLKDPTYDERFSIPTKIGGDVRFDRNFFNSTSITTGNVYKEVNGVLRQQYDFGRKDSLVTDTTVIKLFYPSFRIEHTLKLGNYDYNFRDLVNGSIGYAPDSAYYFDHYHLLVPANDSITLTDRWREISNDFSIYQFPDPKNLQQFFKVGITYQFLRGDFKNGLIKSFYNFMGHGEYRNRTRNKKWDIEAFGNLYLNGYNAGDYHGYISLQRQITPKWGSLQVGFENVNQSPSFKYDTRSSFYFDTVVADFSKQNTTHFFGTINSPALRLQLRADYYLVSNYLYLADYSDLRQESGIFNVLRLGALKTVRFGRYWRLYAELYAQQKAGNAEVNFPSLFTRNRLAFEGTFFRNLNLSTGLELRYHTPYKADNYSPVLGQFFFQDSVQIQNRPEFAAFFNFRIRSFKAFIRAENLNTISTINGFGFKRNNLAAPDYPYPGLVIRTGIYWSFVN